MAAIRSFNTPSNSKSKGFGRNLFSPINIVSFIFFSLFLFFIWLNGLPTFFRSNSVYYTNQTKIINNVDRSLNYNVKVLPSNINELLKDSSSASVLTPKSFSYLTIIDAGSSGCRAHVYRYGKLGSVTGPIYVLPQHISFKVTPGLSSFSTKIPPSFTPTSSSNTPSTLQEDMNNYLKDLVKFLKENIPEEEWSSTPIWLKATAGLRLLQEKDSQIILNSVRNYLLNKEANPFLFKRSWAKVISGNEEGGFGWIAYNYLKNIIGPFRNLSNNEDPYTVIEMGGASTQVTQLAPTEEDAKKIPPEYQFNFEVEGTKYSLYTHSYLGFGAEQAKALYMKIHPTKEDECLNKNQPFIRRLIENKNLNQEEKNEQLLENRKLYFDNECVDYIKKLYTDSYKVLQASTASAPSTSNNLRGEKNECDTIGPFTFNCVHQPDFVIKSKNILAFENYFYMSSALDVKPSDILTANESKFPLVTTPENILKSSQEFCSYSWEDLQSIYPKDKQDKKNNEKMCFLSTYSYSFLVDGLHMDAKKEITIQKFVDNNEIEWAIGAAYKEIGDFLKIKNLRED